MITRPSRPRHLRVAVLVAALASLLLVLPLPSTSPASAAPPTAPGADPVGVWPLRPQPRVVAAFDPPPLPWAAGHRGVDLAGHPGQAVHAALAGTVSFAGAVAGRPLVVVSHGDTRTTYEPVAAAVEVGDSLGAGTPVGRLLTAGSHCFPATCLHWGWIAGETYLDPLRLVRGVPIRLLPLWRDLPAIGRPWVTPRVTPWGAPAGRPDAAGPW